jgi:hypothetical protein
MMLFGRREREDMRSPPHLRSRPAAAAAEEPVRAPRQEPRQAQRGEPDERPASRGRDRDAQQEQQQQRRPAPERRVEYDAAPPAAARQPPHEAPTHARQRSQEELPARREERGQERLADSGRGREDARRGPPPMAPAEQPADREAPVSRQACIPAVSLGAWKQREASRVGVPSGDVACLGLCTAGGAAMPRHLAGVRAVAPAGMPRQLQKPRCRTPACNTSRSSSGRLQRFWMTLPLLAAILETAVMRCALLGCCTSAPPHVKCGLRQPRKSTCSVPAVLSCGV